MVMNITEGKNKILPLKYFFPFAFVLSPTVPT